MKDLKHLYLTLLFNISFHLEKTDEKTEKLTNVFNNLLKEKRFYFVIFRDTKLKSSCKRVSVECDEFPMEFIKILIA
jgi:hypothetical protein